MHPFGIPSQFDSIVAEVSASEESAEETALTSSFGDVPVLIFSKDLSVPPPGRPMSLDALKKLTTTMEAEQESLKKLSTHSRRIIAKGSRHFIQIERADLLNREVPVFIDEVRTHTTSSKNGTTATE